MPQKQTGQPQKDNGSARKKNRRKEEKWVTVAEGNARGSFSFTHRKRGPIKRLRLWFRSLPLFWRIIIGTVLVAIIAPIAWYSIPCIAFILSLVFLCCCFAGLGHASGHSRQSDDEWYEENDPRGRSSHHV